MISTRRDKSIAAYIQELNQDIRRQENQMCASMIDLKKVVTRNMELEEELKSTRDGYEEEISVILQKNEDMKKKLGVFMGDPTPGGDDDHPEDYIIIDNTDSNPDSDDDYEDEGGADIMESSFDQNF
ncbi:hypothetical protein VPH35_124927 [Triticum aestivum]